MKENKINLKTRFDLFTKIISDFRSYKSRTDEIEIMFSIPKNMKTVLRQVSRSDFFSELLIKNETAKIERRKQDKKKILLKRRLTKEEEDFQNNEKLINNKRALNTSCFGQRTVSTLNQFFNSVSETKNLQEDICDIILNLEKESFYTFIDILKGNIQKETSFIFINKDSNFYKEMEKLLLGNKNVKEENNKKIINENNNEIKNEITFGDKTFSSLDDYYKFIKKQIEDDKDNKYSQYGLFMKSMELKRKLIKSQRNNFPLLKNPIPIRNNKKPFIQKSYQNLSNLPNIGFLNIMNRNKNIKNVLYTSKVNQGILKDKKKLVLNDYDYGSILDIYTRKTKNENRNNTENQINSDFHNYYNTQLLQK